MRPDMEVKPALCPTHRSLLPDGKQLILHSSTALSNTSLASSLIEVSTLLLRLFPRHSQEEFSQKIGNPFPTAWDISLSIVFVDIAFAPPVFHGQKETRQSIWSK